MRVPNGHTATYIFFSSIIRLGLFTAPIGFINQINYFLYRWDPDAPTDENKRRKNADNKLHRRARKAKVNKGRHRNSSISKSRV